MAFHAKTDIGLVRKENQDSFALGELEPGLAWAVVCDGMGGPCGGKLAGEIAVEFISERIKKCFEDGLKGKSVKNMLLSALEGANHKIYEKAESDPNLKGMGTTAIAMVIFDKELYLAYVGDSRAYIIDEKDIKLVTRDHSLVQLLIETGEISEESAKTHPQRNVITRALGVSDNVEVDFRQESFGKGKEFVLLCTDGLSNALTSDEIFEVFETYKAENLADTLIEKAKRENGSDNITAVIYENISGGK
ncbi:MAG: Stp1/IreP family PP2C-type Ser/Thr phosphatase [Clostridiales bacterium]|nr:Stp1/IreP family PP2C-type Ser/Thr phosphatase [Clostridiales bacterium]